MSDINDVLLALIKQLEINQASQQRLIDLLEVKNSIILTLYRELTVVNPEVAKAIPVDQTNVPPMEEEKVDPDLIPLDNLSDEEFDAHIEASVARNKPETLK